MTQPPGNDAPLNWGPPEGPQQTWGQPTPPSGPVYPTLGARPAGQPGLASFALPQAPAPWYVAVGIVALPVLAALALVVTLSAFSPLISGASSPALLVLGLIVTGALGYGTWRTWRGSANWKAKTAGGVLGALLLAGFAVGAPTQVVVDGHPELTGSAREQTYRMSGHLLAATEVVRENQKLMRLPEEQAKSLLPMFDAAAAQSGQVAAEWNPATAGEPPTPALQKAYAALNAAAAWQQEALLARKQYLLDPDAQTAATIAQLYGKIEAAVQPGPESILEAVTAAYREVGITEAPSAP